jgi:beta-phosphoglucomutase-like phosphatase (HAD superfamily)
MDEMFLTRSDLILFDLDGVLLNSMPFHLDAFNELLNDFGKQVHISDIAGLKTRDILSKVLKEFALSDVEIDVLVKRKRKFMEDLFSQNKIPLIDDNLIKYLTLLNVDFSLGVCTSGSKNTLDYFLKSIKSPDLFKILLCDADVNFGKPNPEIYLKACAILNVDPINAIVVEDSISGIQSAVAAKCNVIVYNYAGDIDDVSSFCNFNSFKKLTNFMIRGKNGS